MPISLPIFGLSQNLKRSAKCGELMFECVECDYSLPEMWHQAFCDILEPPVVNQLKLLCQWCSQASGFNKSSEISQFAIKAFWLGNGKMMDNISISMIDNIITDRLIHMMTSSNGNIFCVTGPLCGEFTGHQWILLTKASDAELSCFLWSAPE